MKFIPITLLVVLANLLSFYPNHNYYSTTFTQHKEGTPEHPLFKVKQSNLRSNQFAGQLKKGTILQIDSSRLHEIKDAKSFKLELDIPFQNQIIQVELHQVNLFADDFKVRTSDRNDPYPVTPGLFYSGHVKNDPKSLVSFSIFEGEVNGIFSLPELGDIALVKTTSAEDEYMVFSDNDLTGTPDKFECLNQDNDTKLNKIRSQVEQHLEERAAGCISVDFEFDDEIYKDFGSNITTVTNWFTSLFNHIKTIYANEQIEITIKSLYIWTTADPYSSTVGTALDQVMASRQNDPSFTGNLHHLVLGYVSQSVGISGVAYVDVLCSRTYRFGTTRLYQYTTWSTFPSTYQWDIGSIAHEIGHNFGSHHTQWCGWTGGPIDNCYAVEGTCSPGPAPVNGGTIMSYCHLNTNYPMSNGFGPLPHTEIYNNFVAATCKSTSCSGIVTPTPTCSDGIQNGDETGVDCGGSCVACGGGGTGACPSPTLISQGKTASQSTNYSSSNPGPAALTVDGNTSTVNHTAAELLPWWQVDLGNTFNISSIEIDGRKDCCGNRLKNFRVFISNSPVTSFSASGFIFEFNNAAGMSDAQIINIPNLTAQGRYVRVWANNGSSPNYLHIAEVKVFGCSSTSGCSSNIPPSVSLSSPSNSYPANSSFSVTANATDNNGLITKVEFYNGATLLSTDYDQPYSISIDPAFAGSYSFTAKAFDDCNATTVSNPLTITTTHSCSDGIQNGDETGVDCGGSCVACGGGGTGACPSPTLISQGKTASQSTNYSSSNPGPAALTVDGNTSTVNHTAAELLPWWQVDLGNTFNISSIEIDGRKDCCGNRLKNFRVFISNSPVTSYSTSGFVFEFNNPAGMSDAQIINIPNLSAQGRYVRVWANNGSSPNYLHIAEVKVFGCSSTSGCSSNIPPSVSLSSPSNSYPANSSFSVTANATDNNGLITKVEFYNGATLLSTDYDQPYSISIDPASAGSYSFTAKAFDDCNATTVSNPLTITTTHSCSDGIQNGDETGVDCGGSCTACGGGGTGACPSPTLISQGKTASQSTNYNSSNPGPAALTVDGNTSTVNHTAAELLPWWQVDLGNTFNISSIEIDGRKDCCGNRLKNFRVFISNTPISSYSSSGSVFEYNIPAGMSDGQIINIPNLTAQGRYVRVWANNGSSANYLHIAEVKVFGCSSTAAVLHSSPNLPALNLRKIPQVFPNPASKFISIQYSNTTNSAIQNIQIVDFLGRQHEFISTYSNKIDISLLKPGYYLLIYYIDGDIFVSKFLKTE